MHYFSNLFDKILYMFQTGPLSIIRSISTLYTRNRYCNSMVLTTLADANSTSMTNTYCVYTVWRYSWGWTVDLSKTCRILYQINLRNSASCWLLLEEYITMHGPLNAKRKSEFNWHNLSFLTLSVIQFFKQAWCFRSQLCFHFQAKKHLTWWTPQIELFTIIGHHKPSNLLQYWHENRSSPKK